MTTAEGVLIAATATHVGFQATVTALVYPALARIPRERWAEAHRAHSRAITPLVAAIYGALLLTGVWAVWSGPGPQTVAAIAATAVAMSVTAFLAAPLHGRLAAGHDDELLRRLLRADRARTIAAAAALAAALASLS